MNGESITKWKKMGKNGNKKRQLGNKLKKKRIREMKKRRMNLEKEEVLQNGTQDTEKKKEI